MEKDMIAMSKDLVMELIKIGRIQPEDMRDLLQNVHTTLTQLQAQEAGEALSRSFTSSVVDWKKSIRKHSVTCMVCGAVYKQLSARHLSTHDLDLRSYRRRFGIPSDQPLSAKATTALRREIAQNIRPWEKTAKAKRTSK